MNFKSIDEIIRYTSHLLLIGMGSQGTCYYRKKENDVLKIFNFFNEKDYEESKSKDEILKFSYIYSKTFIWPTDVITLNGKVIGYISPFIKARNLYKINPLSINLDCLIKAINEAHDEIKIISRNGIETYDMMYNILYNRHFYVIDEDDYSQKDISPQLLEEKNNQNFDCEIYYFLIDCYFDSIVEDDKLLQELYKYKKENVLIFLKLLRTRLSELSGMDIKYLRDAKKFTDKFTNRDIKKYIRF